MLKTTSQTRKSKINSFQPSVEFHIETTHLIFEANKMTVFCMKYKTKLKWLAHA